MKNVAVIGMGHVGAAVAFTLFTHGAVDNLYLLDKNQAKAETEYNDLRDTLARDDYHVNVFLGDYSDLKNIDTIIAPFSDIVATVKTGDRFGEFEINAKNAKEVGAKTKESGFNGVLINISNPCDAISTILRETTSLSRNQVFGTGTFLDIARMQRIAGEELSKDPRNVAGSVLGEHGASQFAAWLTVLINGKSAKGLFTKEQEEKLSAQPNKNPMKAAFGKGYTSYAIATCGVRLIQTVLSDARLFAPTSVYLDEVGTCIGYPTIIGKNGVEKVIPLGLTSEEGEKLKEPTGITERHIAQLK